MVRKLVPYFRVLFIILTLVLSQFQTVLAVTQPVVEAKPGEEPARQVPIQGCKIAVSARFVDRGTIPTPREWTSDPGEILGATPVNTIQPGQTLTAWIFIGNVTLVDNGADCTGVPEAITNINATISINGQQRTDYSPELATTLSTHGEYTETFIEFEVPSDAPGSYMVQLTVQARDSDGGQIFDSDQSPTGDGRTAVVEGPAFGQVSFDPDLATPRTAPGELVDYKLIITNPRVEKIVGIQVVSETAQFETSCNAATGFASGWTLYPAGTPITAIDKNVQAQCLIENVLIPSTGVETFQFSGELTVIGEFGKTYTAEVTSSLVEIDTPEVSVTKVITEIRRPGVTGTVQPPAMAGDVIHYLITIKNAGEIDLDNITMIDSLTGMPSIAPTIVLEPDAELPINTTYTVRPDSPDPLTNRVSVSARGIGTSRTVYADASVSVDLADSALSVDLTVEDLAGNPIVPPDGAEVGETIRYRLRITNTGTTSLTNVKWERVSPPLLTVGFDPALDTIPDSLAPGEPAFLTKEYTIQAGDDDPLTSTVRFQARSSTNQIIYGQDQVTVDIVNPNISIGAVVTDPVDTNTILRGNQVDYRVTVTNGAVPICNVRVDQIRRDPSTGAEVPIITGMEMVWDSGVVGQLEAGQSAVGNVSYQVTGIDRDPLHMIFKVTAISDCAGTRMPLVDRTSVVLDLSDVEVNLTLQADTGDGVAELDESVLFTLHALNVGPVTLSDLYAEYCFPHKAADEQFSCTEGKQGPITLSRNEILSLDQPAVGTFSYRITDEDLRADPFIAQATLYGTDSDGKRVSIKAAVTVSIATENLLFNITGPAEAVIGDPVQFNFTLTNDTGVRLTNIRIFNTLIPDAPDNIYNFEFLKVYEAPSLDAGASLNGPIDYVIAPNVGIHGDMLTMRLRVWAQLETVGGEATALDTLNVSLIPILTVNKLGPGAVIAGEPVPYNITIHNESVAQTVTVTGYLDEVLSGYGLNFDNSDFAGDGWDPASGVLQPGGTMQSQGADFTIPSVNEEPTPLVNQFFIYGNRSYDDAPVTGFDDHSVNVRCPVEFLFNVINTDAPNADYIMHETLNWQITVRNITQTTLNSVIIKDTLHWDGTVPGFDGITLGPLQELALPPFSVEITNDFYHLGEDYVTDVLTATFTPVAGAQECVTDHKVQIFSPIGVVKSADPSLAFTGETVSYSIYVYSVTEADDQYPNYYVTVTDSLLASPIPLHYNGPGNPPTTSGEVGPEEVTDPPTVVTRDVLESDPDELINVARATFPDPAEPDEFLYTEDDALVLTSSPLLITKTPSVRTDAVPGTVIDYDYTITNISPFPVVIETLIDDKIGELIPGRISPTITLMPNELYAPDELQNVPYEIPMDADDPLINIVTATAILDVPEPEEDRPFTATATAKVDLEDPDVTVDKYVQIAGDPPVPLEEKNGIVKVEASQDIQFCFLIKNNNAVNGPSVYDIVLIDTFLGNDFLQTKFEEAVAALPGTHGTAELFGQEFVTPCSDPIRASSLLPDPHVNTVTLDGKRSVTDTPIHDEDKVTVDILGNVLRITKAADPFSAVVGETVTYTVTITNMTNHLISNIDVTDQRLGGGLVDLDECFFGPTGQHQLTANQSLSCEYNYTVKATDPDPLVNEATVTGLESSGSDPIQAEDTTRAAVAITESQLRVTKEARPAVANPGDTVQYTVSITNLGPKTVNGVTASDPVYDEYHEGDQPTLDDLIESLELPRNLQAFTMSQQFSYNLTMPTADELQADRTLDPFVNTVTASGVIPSSTGGPDTPVQSTADATVDILMPTIRLSKSPVFLAAAPGQNVEYTIMITNLGGKDETLKSIVFTDEESTEPAMNLDTICADANPATCKFVYGPEPFKDHDGDGDEEANPMQGELYLPSRGLRQYEQLIGSITVQVPEDIATNEFTNFAEVSARTTLNAEVWDRTSATIDIRSEGINVEKRASVTSAPMGTRITYTIVVTNVGAHGSAINQLTFIDEGMDQDTVIYDGPFPDSPEPDGEDQVDDSDTLDENEVFDDFTYEHTLSPDDPDPYINTVTVWARTTTNASVMNTAQAVVDIQTAEVAVEKLGCVENDLLMPLIDPNDCTTVVNIGDANTPDVVTYYVRISNPGLIRIENITITDSLVGSIALDTITWPGDEGVLEPNDNMPGGPDEVWFQYSYTIPPNAPDPLVNTVSVNAQAASGFSLQAVDTASMTLVTSDLQVIKTADVTQAQVGQDVTYTLRVRNINPDPAANPISNVMVFDPMFGTGVLCGPLVLNVGTPVDCPALAPHTVSLADASPLVNTARATGEQNGVAVSDTATFTVEIVTPGLSVTKTANTEVASINDVITYTYVVTNTTGNAILGNLSVTDSDPAIGDFGFNEAWPDFLGVGQTAIRTATHTVTAQDPDPLTNTVTVTAMLGAEVITAQTTETVYIADGDLVVRNTPNVTYARVGENVVFTYTVQNVGISQIDGILLTDNLCGLDAQAPSVLVPGSSDNLLPGASFSFDCVHTAAVPGSLISTVFAEGDLGGVRVFDTATAEVMIIPADGGLLVEKTAVPQVARPGDVINYQVTVTNVGTETLNNIVVDDPVAPLLPAPPTTLAMGESFILNGSLPLSSVPAELPDSITNTVTVTAVGATAPNRLYEESASATVAIVTNPSAQLVITKVPDRQRVALGGTITYTFQIQNIGDDTLNDQPGVDEVRLIDDPVFGLPVLLPYPLAPGGVYTTTGSVTVPVDYVLPTYDNTAEVTLNFVPEDTASASVLVELLSLTKTVSSTLPVPIGGTIEYAFIIENLSSGTVNNVSLVDDDLSGTPLFTGSLGPNEVRENITGSFIIPASWFQPTFINTAQVLVDGVEIDEASATATIQLVELTKVANPQEVPAGGRVDYTFTVTNLSTTPLTGLTLRELLPAPPTIFWDTQLAPSIAGSGTTVATGHLFIPFTDPFQSTFTNTARVLVDENVMDEATETVTVLPSPIGVEIVDIYQTNGADPISDLQNEELQTGKLTTVSFSLRNLGSTEITGLDYNFIVTSTDPAQNVTCNGTLPTTLPVSATPVDVLCTYTPQAGATHNTDLTPEVRVEVSATGINAVTASREVTYVDLLLGLTLTINPDTAEPGDSVNYTVQLTNLGASPIGCGAAVPADQPCHLRPDFGGDAVLQGLFGDELAGIVNTILQPFGQIGSETEFTEAREIGAGDTTVTHTLIVRGGWGAATQNAAYYTVEATAEATLTIGPVEPESALVIENLDVFQTDSTLGPIRLLQTGKLTSVVFDLSNAGTVDITDLSYIVRLRVNGDPVDLTCWPVGTLPTSLAPDDEPVRVLCRYIPTIGAEHNTDLTPTLVVVARGKADGEDVQDTATTEIEMVDLQIDIQLDIDPAEAMPGDEVTYTVTLTNLGASPIGCDAGVGAGLPCHLQLMTGGDSGLNETLIDVFDEVRNEVLQPADSSNDTAIFMATRTIDEDDESITHTLVVRGGYWSEDLEEDHLSYYIARDEDSATLNIGSGEIEVLLVATPNPPIYGSTITYTITIRNTGGSEVTDLVATWQISPLAASNVDGIMLMSSDPHAAAQTTSGQITLSPNAIAPGSSVTGILAKTEDQTRNYQFLVTVIGNGVSDPVTASASLTLSPTNVGTPTPTGTLTATLDPNAVDPQVAKQPSSGTAQPGGAVVWTITIRNGGTAAMPNVTMKDAVPDTLTLNSATTSKGTAVTEGQLLTVATGPLNPGEVVTVTVNTTVASGVTAPAQITNTACAARDGGPQVCVNASVNLGPNVGGLPSTGISGFDSWPLGSLLAVFLAGALMILMSAEISSRRLLFVGLFVMIALAVLVGAVVLLVTRDDDEKTETPVAQVPSETPVSTVPSDTVEPSVSTETPVPPGTDAPFATSPVNTPYIVPEPTGPRSIIIPKLADQFSAPIPIIDLPIVDNQWDVSGLGYYVGWLEGTTWMDPSWGNTVLAAHVQLGFRNPGPFWGLGELVPGDEIIVMEGDVERKFMVTSSRKVDPEDWTVTAPTDGPTLTLLTCTEWDRAYGVFSQRMVIQAIPVEQVG